MEERQPTVTALLTASQDLSLNLHVEILRSMCLRLARMRPSPMLREDGASAAGLHRAARLRVPYLDVVIQWLVAVEFDKAITYDAMPPSAITKYCIFSLN